MSATRRGLKWLITLAAAALFVLAAAFGVSAAETIPVLESRLRGDQVLLFLRNSGALSGGEARIGTEKVTKVQTGGAGRELPVRTYLLLDNSVSIPSGSRGQIAELLDNLFGGKLKNEAITLCTFSDHLNILTEDSDDFTELKGLIDSIQYVDQETYLTDVAAEVLAREASYEGDAYVRMIVISDGVDNNPGGITRTDLERRLSEGNLPIYTVGVKRKGNEQNLKEMYSLSRITGAESWTLGEVERTLDIATAMSGSEVPVPVSFQIPEAAKDGGRKGVQVTFSDGSQTDVVQMVMPFGEVRETTAAETTAAPTEPEEEEPETEPEPLPDPTLRDRIREHIALIGGIAGFLLLLAVIFAVVMFFRKKQKEEKFVPVLPEWEKQQAQRGRISQQIRSGSGYGSNPYQNAHQGLAQDNFETDFLVEEKRNLMLRLEDLRQPGRKFEYPLRGPVKVGKNPQLCQIVIDYDRTVSKVHCEIFADGRRFRIRDLNSTNGTFVDGMRVGDMAELYNGSTIRLGRVELKVWMR